MSPRKWTISKLKKFFAWWKDLIDSIDKVLTAYKWLRAILSIAGLLSVGTNFFTVKKSMDKDVVIQQKNDTIKVKTDSIITAKTVCTKAMDDNPDTAKKYKKLVKVFYMKPVIVDSIK